MHNTLKVRFTKQNQQQNKLLWLWWVCWETMRFRQFVFAAMTPTGSLWAEPPLEADVSSTGSNKRRWSIYPSFAGRKFQTFSPPKFFWKFENLSGFNEAELSTTNCSLAIFILDYTNTCYCKFCSIIVNNPCTLDKPIFMTFYQYNNQWKRIAAATVNSRQSTRDVADEK